MEYCYGFFFFFFQAEDGIRDGRVTGVQTCALPISLSDEAAGVSLPSAREQPATTAARERTAAEAANRRRVSRILGMLRRPLNVQAAEEAAGGRVSCRWWQV